MNTMTPASRTQYARRLDEATEWMLRLQNDAARDDAGDEVSDDTIAAWVQWCEADVHNQAAFDEIRQFWSLSQGLGSEVVAGELVDVMRPHSVRQEVLRQEASHQGLFATFKSRFFHKETLIYKRLWHRPRFALATVGAVVGSAVLSALLWSVFRAAPGDAFSVARWFPVSNDGVVAAQERARDALLSDGSQIQLAAKSAVAVHYTADNRGLELQSGEAFFSVAPNRQRPFIVAVGAIRVRAVGTAFNVRRAGERIVVTVTQGAVEVYRVGSSANLTQDRNVHVVAGAQATWSGKTSAPKIVSIDTRAALAWREGRLEYVDEPLEGVIADLNRYTRRPAIIVDDSARTLRFSGTVRVDSTQEWLAALPGILPLRVHEENGVDVIRASTGSNTAD